MKGEKVMNIYSDFPVLRDLIQLKNENSRLTSGMKDRIQILLQGSQLLVLYRCCLTILDNTAYYSCKFSTFREMQCIDATLKQKRLWETGVLALDSGEFQDWDTLSSELLEEIQSYKPTIREGCFNSCDSMLDCNFSVDQLQKLMRYIIVSMANILLLKGDTNPDEKMKFESLKEKLDLFRKVFKFSRKHRNSDYEVRDFKLPLEAWAWNAACLCLVNWLLDEKDETMAPKMDLFLSKLQLNFNNVLPNVTRMCLSFLKTTKPSANEHFKVAELVSRFVEVLLGNLRGYLPMDGTEMLHDGMILLITFLMDPPRAQTNAGRLILTQASIAVDDAASLIISLGSGEMKDAGTAEASNSLLHDFTGKVNTIKAEVRKIYPQLLLDSPSFNCPRINTLRLFDSIIENFKEIPFHFSNHPILRVQEELVLLRNLLKASNLKESFISDWQNEHKKLKDLWTRISNVVHQADRTIRSFIYLESFLWVDMLCLFDVKEKIKRIRSVIRRIQNHYMQDTDARSTDMNLSPVVPSQTNVQKMDEVVVGFEDKVNDIQAWLRSGSEKLNIISIIGMPGLGKTTLAKKVYNDPSVKRHFTMRAWCTVSQSYEPKKLLLDILNDVTAVNDSFFQLEEEDLAFKLKKCLKGQRYLIVMDDIWNVGAWSALKLSFPDDENGSRILFTSRIQNVVLDAKPDSFAYPLSPLSDKESWELLKRKLFHDKDVCPIEFVKVGGQIARDCKGIPLAVVLVSGILKKKIENLDWWKQVGESLNSIISKEGCAHILELSYKHLPEPLKACFLYFGLFQEDRVIRVQKLIQLWVSEGFIQKQEMKTVELVAKEYAMDLVDRSLLIVSNRSSDGGIKACRIHDLLREFCLAKSAEENFFKLLHGNDASQFSKDTMNKHYRVCIQTQHWSSFHIWNSSPLHSLLVSPAGSFKPFGMDDSSFCNARFLQVLDFDNVKFLGDFPEEVTDLFFLRYLAIWCTTKSIPPEIERLGYLETLSVKTGNSCVFPFKILQMENLRHVDIGLFSLQGLFRNVPPMKNIQSISCPHFTYGKETEIFLRKMPTIRKLRCQFNRAIQDFRITKLDFLNHLESLNMTSQFGYRPMQPDSFNFFLPTTLKKLTLTNFGFQWSEISRIAKLPNLEVLKLLASAFAGRWWNMEDDKFSKLKYLKLQKLNFGQWSASDENFPSLEQIVVEQCHKLQEIPTTFGKILTLRMIQVRRCRPSVASSAMEIQEEQIDSGNTDFKLLTVQIL